VRGLGDRLGRRRGDTGDHDSERGELSIVRLAADDL
jgi:hypothetical protein